MNIWETDTFLARWLNDELSSEEKQAFEKSDEFKHYQQIKDTLEHYEAPAYDEDAALEEALSRIQSKKKKVFSIKSFTQYAVAASVLIATCLAIYVAFLSDKMMEVTAIVQEEINLPDGSSIELSKGSYVKYSEAKWDEKRAIQLKGEAFFEVEKGVPFEVQLAGGTVSVLGTSFNVLEKDDALEVVCYSGKVKVEAFEKSQIIEAGQSVLLQVGKDPILNETYLNEPTWVDQVASYKNVELSVVLAQLEQLYDIEVVGAYNETLHYTGQFPTDDLEVALDQLFGPYKIKYRLDTATNQVRLLND